MIRGAVNVTRWSPVWAREDRGDPALPLRQGRGPREQRGGVAVVPQAQEDQVEPGGRPAKNFRSCASYCRPGRGVIGAVQG